MIIMLNRCPAFRRRSPSVKGLPAKRSLSSTLKSCWLRKFAKRLRLLVVFVSRFAKRYSVKVYLEDFVLWTPGTARWRVFGCM